MTTMNAWLSNITFKRAACFSASLGYLYVGFLCLVPGDYRAHTISLPVNTQTFLFLDKLEHALAYALLGALTVIAVRHKFEFHRILIVMVAIVAFAGLLEISQVLIPGRDNCLDDFAVSAAGGIFGTSMTYLVSRYLPGTLSLNIFPAFASRRLS